MAVRAANPATEASRPAMVETAISAEPLPPDQSHPPQRLSIAAPPGRGKPVAPLGKSMIVTDIPQDFAEYRSRS
jgi:hypothetical protein